MLELKDISFEVADENGGIKRITDNINLTLGDNKFIVVTGPNGSGKSTLARLIMGIQMPTSGKILYNGEDITDKGITERARLGISFAFQQPVRFKGLNVHDLLKISAKKDLSVSEACLYLSKVGLCAKDYINREVNASLSGGELKRIEIAMIMARGTNFSIFDEPEAGIDLWSFTSLINVFEEMRKHIKGTILIISHQERILNIADEIVVIDGGRITQHGSKEEVLPSIYGTTAVGIMCDGTKGGVVNA